MIVLKLGGSLLSSPALMQCLQLASQKGQGQLVIVPGGGVFADQVRLTQKKWQYDDKAAHYMAILAMQQMALLFQGLCADLVLVDMKYEWRIKAENLNSKTGWTPYEGWHMRGAPKLTMVRGKILMEDFEVVNRPGYGEFLPRRAPPPTPLEFSLQT